MVPDSGSSRRTSRPWASVLNVPRMSPLSVTRAPAAPPGSPRAAAGGRPRPRREDGTARLAAGDERGPPGSSREDSSQRFTGGGGQIRYRGVEREDLLIEQYHIRATRPFPACLGAFC